MKIKHLKYKEIDFKKYDTCIKNAINSRVYAYSWYLDIVCKNDWEVLILGDYESVMPLPLGRIKRKLFKKMIVQPYYCQQLGVFSFVKLSENIHTEFIKTLLKLKPYIYQFNSFYAKNFKDINNFEERINYELDLDKPFEELSINFSKNLKRNIKKAKNNNVEISNNISIESFIALEKKFANYINKKNHFREINSLINSLIQNKMGVLYAAFKNDELIAASFIAKTKNRIVNLYSVSSIKGKQFSATPLIFEKIIKDFANKNYILDFEGSMIVGIARFFKSFGAEQVNYHSLKNFK